MALQPFEWKDKPALIEHLFPVQKISAESFKEQEARQSKTLTPLGSYWKGRKPLILNKACILGCLLPVTEDRLKDLEIFELLMGMDSTSIEKRMLEKLPPSKRDRVHELKQLPYSEQVENGKRPEEMDSFLFSHIWGQVNSHLGTSAASFPQLIEQLGVARFGHRPKVADVFSGSGQIPFEAARLGCDVYASDLNPIAAMLTWGSLNIITDAEIQSKIKAEQEIVLKKVREDLDALGVESDGKGWYAKAFLYCVEVKCPETGWLVPLLPHLVSQGHAVVARLIPDIKNKRYDIEIEYVDELDPEYSNTGSIRSDGPRQDSYVYHVVDGKEYRIKIPTIRGDSRDGKNNLRQWTKDDVHPRDGDVFGERLYAILWTNSSTNARSAKQVFKSVTEDDLAREQKVLEYVKSHLQEWQENGFIPDMVIEAGDKTDEPIRTRGWTHWHHLFNPRQLLVNGLINKYTSANLKFAFTQVLNNNSRLSRWNARSGVGQTASVFDNQALNTLYNYGCRGLAFLDGLLSPSYKCFPIPHSTSLVTNTHPAQEIDVINDIYVTDPPYGDAVKYEEITEFFIAWMRRNPPKEFSHWTWDSRRSLAVKGEDEGFRTGMVAAYRKTAQKMPENGIQVLMFTHQSGSIWADMANIVWASGLQVTAAWYVVTETDSTLRDGAYVTGTIMLVLRKRKENLETFRDDLGWEIEEAVKGQVEALAGLDRSIRNQGSEGLYTDADLQMAGYAAALKVLTAYSRIDGKDMVTEAEAPRQKGKKTFVDELIDFAVQTAVQFLVPVGFEKGEWQKLQAIERFYLKMAEMEHQGAKTLDNYQNFAKAFKVHHFDQLMSDASKANSARLKLSTEFRSAMMAGDAEIAGTPLRALLYALFELSKEVEVDDVLLHLMENCPNYLPNKQLLAKMADYLAEKREGLKGTKAFNPEQEASCARVLAEAIRNQRL
jgi:putative DNA methylase